MIEMITRKKDRERGSTLQFSLSVRIHDAKTH